MNREQRRRLNRGKKKTATLAGVSLAAASGLFGAYLGNGRIPKAYAAVTCNTSTTYSIASQANWISAVAAINGAGATYDCFVLNITSDFTVSTNLAKTAEIDLSNQSTPKKITVNGNGHTVTGDNSVPVASWMYIKLPKGKVNEAHISDLTITGMHVTGDYSEQSPVANIWAPNDGPQWGVTNQYWDNVYLHDNTSGQCWNGVVSGAGEFHVSGSHFARNSHAAICTYGYALGGVFQFFSNKNGPAVHSSVTDSIFEQNAVSTPQGYAMGGAIFFQATAASSLTIENSTFDGNSATGVTDAYAGAVATNVPLVVRESVFTDNTATAPDKVAGGAIAINSGPPAYWGSSGAFGGIKVYDSLFSGNEVTQTAGAINKTAGGGAISGRLSPDGLQIESSTFDGNLAQANVGTGVGGAVAFTTQPGAVLSIVNSTISGNTSTGGGGSVGGGILSGGAPLTVDFSTITGNYAATGGGGIYSRADDTITNSIVNANTVNPTSGLGADVVRTGGTTTVSDHSLFTSAGSVYGTFTYGADTLFSASAQVGAVADNGGTVIGAPGATQTIRTMLPLRGAAVLDAGTVTPVSGVLPATDERGTGFPRVVGGLTNMGAVQGVAAPPTPPPPPPVFPPSAPRDVAGVPGDREVAVSWSAPAAAGSFPVTDYRVVAAPGGASCLAKAPALTCTVTGLTNGTPYTFVVSALNGAGWGADGGPSAPVTPSAKARSLTLFQGKRAADGRHDRITTGGTSVGVPAGSQLTPWIRYGDTGAFVEGVASIVVGSHGEFTWTRQIRKDRKFTAYVAYEDLESNRVTWQRVR